MATESATSVEGDSKVATAPNTSRSLEVAKRGIETAKDFAHFMSALMTDLIEGTVGPQIGNATCNAGGKLLKVVEMELKYGTVKPHGGGRELLLANGMSKRFIKR